MDDPQYFKRLETTLKNAARRAYAEFKEKHPEERFYTFALITDDQASFVLPTANTEEALQQRFGRKVEPEEEPWLRWYPSEWDLQYEAREHFHEVQRILDEFDFHSDEVSEEEAETHVNALRDTCARVLADLDAEGVFGSGATREDVVVILMESDQSNEERIAWAKRLNPEVVSRRFETELETAQAVWERKQRAGLL